ncbi:MAG: quercetin 2,3-dioxygenase [Balneolaceae bacterium]|nr:quercetin 2,3-dioxygenase [Balneolaceae bacterium]
MNTLEPKYIKRGEGEHVKVLADNITIKVSSEETHGQFAVVETNNEAGAGVPPHYHTNEDEVFYIVEGEAEFMVHGKKIVAGPGDTIFGPRNVPHAYTFLKPTKMLVTIAQGGFERMFKEVHNMDQSNIEEVVKTFNKYGVFLAE